MVVEEKDTAVVDESVITDSSVSSVDSREVGSDERQVVVFSLGKEEFGVNISEVKEIIRITEFTQIPNSSEFVRGVINLRGGIIAVVDLAAKLNLPSAGDSKNSRIIIVEVQGNTVGLIVDSATEVLRIPEAKIKPAPKLVARKINAAMLEGVCVLEERLLILLDLESVLSSQDVASVVAEASASAAGKQEGSAVAAE